MPRWLIPFLAGLLLIAAAPPLPAPLFEGILADVGRHMAALASITGLAPKRAVPAEIISRERVRQFLEERVKEIARPEELRAEELVLKRFGLLPRDFDLVKTTVDLLTEQGAAFYDFNRKKLYISDWTPAENQEPALVHELAHALADQHFNLERFVKKAARDDDGALARLAVAEGQATWLMSEHLAQKLGLSLRNSSAGLEMMSRAFQVSPGQFPVFDDAPLYLRETLVFPYAQGMLFQQAVWEKLGTAVFAEVFRRPPVSTQQILHPESYFSRRMPVAPPLPESAGLRGFKKTISGTFGELDHRILLRQYAGERKASEIAPGWRGGQYALYQRGESAALAYASAWDSPETARAYFEQYRQVLRQKSSMLEEAPPEAGDAFAGRNQDGWFQVTLRGLVVSSLEGLAEPVR